MLDGFAHGVIVVLGTFARFMLEVLDAVESTLRALLHGAGLGADMQTVLLIFLVSLFLTGVLRLLHGRIRLTAALILILVLAHTLERIAHGPVS